LLSKNVQVIDIENIVWNLFLCSAVEVRRLSTDRKSKGKWKCNSNREENITN